MCYNEGSEFVSAATDYEFYFLQVSPKLFDEKSTILDAKEMKSRTFSPGLKIHGILHSKFCTE